MATNEQKEQLVQILKFTPRTYRIEMSGYGGEVVLGRVDRKVYDYFQKNKIDIEEYARSWEETTIPENLQPFNPGSWYDCDDIAHECGVEMSDLCYVRVYDEHGEQVWEHCLDPTDLEDSEIETEVFSEDYMDFQPEGTVVFYGQNFEKGLFFGGDLHLTEPFDPANLKFIYSDIEGWCVCNTIEYNGESIDSEDYNTTGKSSTYGMSVIGEDPNVTVVGPEEYIPESDSEFTEYFPAIVKPVRKGTYECIWKARGTVYGRLEWDGVNWVNHYNAARPVILTVEQWRGLNWDTSDWSNQPLTA